MPTIECLDCGATTPITGPRLACAEKHRHVATGGLPVQYAAHELLPER